jgi:hypothetical protein
MAFKMKISWIVAGCLLAGVGVAMAAQLTTRPVSTRYVNCGVFSLLGGKRGVFSVSLDDESKQPSARVLLQFIDTEGEVVKSYEGPLEVGKTRSLEIAEPEIIAPVRLRAHAEVREFTNTFTLRRRVAWSVQTLDDLTTEDPGPVCNADGQGSGGGRQ